METQTEATTNEAQAAPTADDLVKQLAVTNAAFKKIRVTESKIDRAREAFEAAVAEAGAAKAEFRRQQGIYAAMLNAAPDEEIKAGLRGTLLS